MSDGRVAKNTAYLTAAFVGQKVLSFVYFTIIARTIGVDGAGRYVIAISFTTMLSIFVDLGLANVLVREVAKFPNKAKSLLANVLGMKVILAILTVIAANIIARLLNYHPETRLMITIASAVMVLDSVHLVLYAAMRGFQNLRYEAIGVVSGQAVTITVGSIFLFTKMPLHYLVVALLFGSTWNVIWAAWCVRRKFGLGLSFKLEPTVIKFFWAVTIPFALAGVFSRIYSYIDSIMLSKLISESSVGLYGVAYKIAFAFQFLPMSFAAAIYPAMSENYIKDRDRLARLFTAAMNYLLIIALPLGTGIAVLSYDFIMLLYGKEYLGSVLPLQILMISLIFAFLYWPAGSLLNACDRQAKNTFAMGITMVVNIVLNAILIPRLSVVGAAIAALVGNFTLWGSAMLFIRPVIKIDRHRMALVAGKTIFSAGCMALALVLLRDHLHVAILVPLGAIVYGVALVGVGGVTVMEIRTFVQTFLKRGKGVSDLMP